MGFQNGMVVTVIFIVSQSTYIIEILWFSININSHWVTELDSGTNYHIMVMYQNKICFNVSSKTT